MQIPSRSPALHSAKAGGERCGIAAQLTIGIQSLNSQIGVPPVDYRVFFDFVLVLIGDHNQLCPSRFCLSSEPIDACCADPAIGVVKEEMTFIRR